MQFPFIKLAHIHQTSSKYKDEIQTLLYICVYVWRCSCECTATQSMRAGFELWVRQAKVTSPRQDGGYGGGGLQRSHDAIFQCVLVCVCANVCECVWCPLHSCVSQRKVHQALLAKRAHWQRHRDIRLWMPTQHTKTRPSCPSHASVLKILGKCRFKSFIEGHCGRLTQLTTSHKITHIHNQLWKEQHLIKAGIWDII